MTSSAQHRDALDTAHPFTRADARAAGISEKSLRGPLYQKVGYDLYVGAQVTITPAVRARAALRVAGPGAYVSHHTAAELWGLPVESDSRTHITVPTRGQRCVRQGLRSHLRNDGASVTQWRGIATSTPEQTFLDLAAIGLPLVELVVVGDALLKQRLTTRKGLELAIDGWTGSGSNRARRAVRLIREGVDSPMETRVRLLLVLAGLPEPRVNVIIRAEDGSWRMRFDLCYDGCRLIIEYDGRKHADDSDQWEHDIFRREELDQQRYRLVVVTSRGIYREPLRTLERVRDALVDCGADGVPRRFKHDWQRHFPAAGAVGVRPSRGW